MCKILYSRNATVYLAGRSEDKCRKAISSIVDPFDTKPTGGLKYLHLDLSDLSTIKSSADEFLRQERRLDWLCNNAGVMLAPAGSKGAQVCFRNPHLTGWGRRRRPSFANLFCMM